ncbi:putative hemerythrin [Septoria linicola]|nr:putative hemerythrin [Septoria linicola]
MSTTTTSTMNVEHGREDAFEKMEEAGVPKTAEPSEVAFSAKKNPEVKPKQEQLEKEKEKKLPKLSAQEFKAYNHMAEHMDMFHNHFRQTWTTLSTACTRNSRPSGMSIRQFLALITQFCHQLTLHHTIEEQHIFPVLAKKMAFFTPEEHALTQHAGIHKGVEELEEWVQEVKEGGREFNLRDLKSVLDGFGEVLWRHLDDEVRTLGAENMRLYWSLEEMRRMPM